MAEVGLVPGTQHFRNILRHKVETDPAVLTLRIDESLYFANARFLEDLVLDRVGGAGALRHVVLMCSAVNEIDLSALESLEAINQRLEEQGILLHLSEVKGPVDGPPAALPLSGRAERGGLPLGMGRLGETEPGTGRGAVRAGERIDGRDRHGSALTVVDDSPSG